MRRHLVLMQTYPFIVSIYIWIFLILLGNDVSYKTIEFKLKAHRQKDGLAKSEDPSSTEGVIFRTDFTSEREVIYLYE